MTNWLEKDSTFWSPMGKLGQKSVKQVGYSYKQAAANVVQKGKEREMEKREERETWNEPTKKKDTYTYVRT